MNTEIQAMVIQAIVAKIEVFFLAFFVWYNWWKPRRAHIRVRDLNR
jgi:hypothetical protein